MSIDKDDIEELLSNWYNIKQQITNLEKKCEKYKQYSEKIMNKLDNDSLESSNYTLKRTSMTRSTISKKDVPVEIWNRYSKRSSFPVYYLHPIDKLKNKKSPSKRKKIISP